MKSSSLDSKDFRTAGVSAKLPRVRRFGISKPDANWMGAFLACAFAFVQFVVDPRLLYQNQMPLFYWGKSFVRDAARQPGGLLDYLGRFVEQFYTFNFVGSLIVVALLGVSWVLALQLSRSKTAEPSKPSALASLFQWLPPCLLLVLVGLYDHSWMGIALPVIAAMGWAVLFSSCGEFPLAVSVVVFGLASALLNHVGGLIAGALFALIVGVPELFASGRRLRGVMYLILGGAIGYAFFYGFQLRTSLFLPEERIPKYLSVAVYLSLLLPALVPLLPQRAQRVPEAAKEVKPARKRAAARQAAAVSTRPLPWPVVVSGVVMVLSLCAAYFLVNPTRRTEIAVRYHASLQQWDAVLTDARHLPSRNAAVRVEIARALFHQGRLLDELLDYPFQAGDSLIPNDYGEALRAGASLAQTLLELGHVNLAEHWAHEALELNGEKPELLEILVKINVLENRPVAAATFAGYLRKNPLYRAWADDFLERLKQDARMQNDPEIARYRSVKVSTDVLSPNPPAISLLLQLLHTNPQNKMAFEYLMGEYILQSKSQPVVQRIKEFAPGKALPRLVEETALDYELQEQRTFPEVDRAIRNETRQRLNEFRKAVSAFQSNPESGRATVAKNFGNTYWYLSMYKTTGRISPSTH